jgi:hypothetical protein
VSAEQRRVSDERQASAGQRPRRQPRLRCAWPPLCPCLPASAGRRLERQARAGERGARGGPEPKRPAACRPTWGCCRAWGAGPRPGGAGAQGLAGCERPEVGLAGEGEAGCGRWEGGGGAGQRAEGGRARSGRGRRGVRVASAGEGELWRLAAPAAARLARLPPALSSAPLNRVAWGTPGEYGGPSSAPNQEPVLPPAHYSTRLPVPAIS